MRSALCPCCRGYSASPLPRTVPGRCFRLPAVLIVAALATGCAAPPVREDPVYIVQPQDTLYSIAWRHNLDYRQLAAWNHVGPDYRIRVGQALRLDPPTSPATPRGSTPAVALAPHTDPAPAPAPAMVPGRPAVGPSPARQDLHWVWPTDHAGSPRSARSGGLWFEGQPGQPVRAAARGRVVYIGSGIRGYGELVIIKHSETLLSAYAYNRDIRVHEGDEVTAGQVISAMGTGPRQIPALYFEIRLNGKPINPLPYLSGKT